MGPELVMVGQLIIGVFGEVEARGARWQQAGRECVMTDVCFNKEIKEDSYTPHSKFI